MIQGKLVEVVMKTISFSDLISKLITNTVVVFKFFPE